MFDDSQYLLHKLHTSVFAFGLSLIKLSLVWLKVKYWALREKTTLYFGFELHVYLLSKYQKAYAQNIVYFFPLICVRMHIDDSFVGCWGRGM